MLCTENNIGEKYPVYQSREVRYDFFFVTQDKGNNKFLHSEIRKIGNLKTMTRILNKMYI